MNAKVRSVAATIILVVAFVYLVETRQLLPHEPIGWVLQGIAILLMLWARITFGRRSFHFAANPTAGGLVTWGPYKYMRNPIYAAVLLFTWTAVAENPGPGSLLVGVVATLATAVRIQAEESELRKQFPEYAAYAAKTKRLVPWIL